jgi:hypothetical protein
METKNKRNYVKKPDILWFTGLTVKLFSFSIDLKNSLKPTIETYYLALIKQKSLFYQCYMIRIERNISQIELYSPFICTKEKLHIS